MHFPPPRQRYASIAARCAVAALTIGCGSPDAAPPANRAALAETAEAEQLAPPQRSDLLSRLGGQTGSEMAQGVPACPARQTTYALADVTPLGFAAAQLADEIAARDYVSAGTGFDPGPIELVVELTPPATFIDRDPSPDPELVCIDAVRVQAVFLLSVPEQLAPLRVTDLYADAPDRFAGVGWLEGTTLQGSLAESALGSDVQVFVESSGDGAEFWFYRDVPDSMDELIGWVVPGRR